MTTANKLEIGGRIYSEIRSSTLEHEFKFYELATRAGLSSIELGPGETPEQLAARILAQILGSGLALEMLGLLLIPADMEPEEWTPALMQETAKHFGAVTEPAEIALIKRELVGLVAGFFESGLASFWTSTTSSVAGAGVEGGPTSKPTGLTGSGTGPRSSSSSPAPTSTRRAPSSAGRSGTPSRPIAGG